MLFEAGGRFRGLDLDAFEVFDIPERERRRRAIVEGFHGALSALGEDLVDTLGAPLHAHLPRLDWPKTYQPFCTWLALSRLAHGYQGEAQLNVGVHRDHVAARYAWDASADSFGRFEFRACDGFAIERSAAPQALVDQGTEAQRRGTLRYGRDRA